MVYSALQRFARISRRVETPLVDVGSVFYESYENPESQEGLKLSYAVER